MQSKPRTFEAFCLFFPCYSLVSLWVNKCYDNNFFSLEFSLGVMNLFGDVVNKGRLRFLPCIQFTLQFIEHIPFTVDFCVYHLSFVQAKQLAQSSDDTNESISETYTHFSCWCYCLADRYKMMKFELAPIVGMNIDARLPLNVNRWIS